MGEHNEHLSQEIARWKVFTQIPLVLMLQFTLTWNCTHIARREHLFGLLVHWAEYQKICTKAPILSFVKVLQKSVECFV